jgi:hypothetical protein
MNDCLECTHLRNRVEEGGLQVRQQRADVGEKVLVIRKGANVACRDTAASDIRPDGKKRKKRKSVYQEQTTSREKDKETTPRQQGRLIRPVICAAFFFVAVLRSTRPRLSSGTISARLGASIMWTKLVAMRESRASSA